jgi:hypothetical protein
VLAFCRLRCGCPRLHRVPPLRDCSKMPAIVWGSSCSALLLLPLRGPENLQQCPPARRIVAPSVNRARLDPCADDSAPSTHLAVDSHETAARRLCLSFGRLSCAYTLHLPSARLLPHLSTVQLHVSNSKSRVDTPPAPPTAPIYKGIQAQHL